MKIRTATLPAAGSDGRRRTRDSALLGLIVLAAFAVRLFTLWVGRPEFTGWFNHTYYYFVQVRGVLEQGRLPYNDMPLLFYAASGMAWTLRFAGMETQQAVVASTRLLMCLAAAALPIPFYAIIRVIQPRRRIPWQLWIIVLITGFLPLSILHIPEFLQKNMFGLFLLSVLIYRSYFLFGSPRAGDFTWFGLLITAIVLTHYGTAAAAVLYAIAAGSAYAMVHRTGNRVWEAGLSLAALGSIVAALIFVLDKRRLYRIARYLSESFATSPVGTLFSDVRQPCDRLLALGAVILWVVVVFFLLRLHMRSPSLLPTKDRIFWLSNIFFVLLLTLPILPEELLARLMLFLSIPGAVVLVYSLTHGCRREWIRTGSVVLALICTGMLAAGELVSAKIHDASNERIFSDIVTLQSRHSFRPTDLILTRMGTEHLCNWFLGVKAGVITALNRDDFSAYSAVYVLNPLDMETPAAVREDTLVTTEQDKYRFMRQNIIRPRNGELLFRTAHLELFRVSSPPEDWIFAADGGWMGYRR